MRLLVIGCGSIGSRRARLLTEMGHEVMLYDADTDRAVALYNTLNHPRVRASLWGNVWTGTGDGYDAAFVCTPADTHLAVARAAIDAGCKALFIEKPLSVSMDGVAELVAECEARGVVTMGACNMRWAYPDVDLRRPSTGEIDFVIRKPLSTWRPGAVEAYRANGVILEAAIHELDVAVSRLGPIIGLEAWGTDDECRIAVRHRDGVSNLSVSWADDPWDQKSAIDGVYEVRHAVALDYISPDTSDEMYRCEMAHFLDCVANGTATCNPIANAAETLRWALKARDMTRKAVA